MLARTTVQHVTRDEIANTEIRNRIRDYHEKLEKVIGDDQYVSTESELERFVNGDVPDQKYKKHMKASGRKVTKSPIKDMNSLILMISLWIQMIVTTNTYLTHI